ncbi:MAG: N-acetylmuramoyl-L-alanine amidase [Bacteroidales bacterium]|nr:N-acetylmuramoyl-L-alanine amidase [Bacteroidales bacterium]
MTLLGSISGFAQSSSQTLKTIVIDAGHGGHDPGAVSKDGKTKEKDITLAISKLFGQKIKAAFPEVKVIYTRTTDVYVTLNERAAIANRNQANLFVSVHINSFPTTGPHGYSAHILGESSKGHDLQAFNLNECKRENSVMLLEDDYSEKYEGFNPNEPESFIFFHLMQNAFYEQSLLFAADVNKAYGDARIFRTSRGIQQDPFWVLWKTAMPSVLVESGFISNDGDLEVLRSGEGPEKIASALLEAFKVFKARYDGSVTYDKKPSVRPEATASTKPEVKAEGEKAAKPEAATSVGATPAPATSVSTTPATASKPESSVGTKPVVGAQVSVSTKPEVQAEGEKAAKPEASVSVSATPEPAASVRTPEASVSVSTTPAPATVAKPEQKATVRYGVQVTATSRELKSDDPLFLGHPVNVYKSGTLNKYIIGETDNEQQAKNFYNTIKEKYPESFIVRIENDSPRFWGRR